MQQPTSNKHEPRRHTQITLLPQTPHSTATEETKEPTFPMSKQQSTPSDQSARSSITSVSTSCKGTKIVTVNLVDQVGSARGKKSKKSMKNGRGQRGQTASLLQQNENDQTFTTHTSSSNASMEMMPQRSRSEAPKDNSIGNVLYEVHKKLINRGRKMSPTKLQAKQQERQQRAEHLRAKIELSRKEWFNKVKQRQQLARVRFQETVEKKRLNLQDRLQQAAKNKRAEIRKVVEKAEAENVKAEETKFIIKLTKQNNKLDLNMKLSENEERRKQQLEREQARIKGQELKREAAEKRRVELNQGMRTKILSKEQKREQAEQRRKEQLIAEKNKAIAERTRRDLVRARKHVQRHKLSDIMSFVSNRESLWEFIGMEQDLDSMGLQFNLGDMETLQAALDDEVDGSSTRNLNERELLQVIQQDQFELEKLMLKRDHEVLSACIVEEPDGSVKIVKSAMALLQRQGQRQSDSEFDSDDSSEEKKESIRGKPSTVSVLSSKILVSTEEAKYTSPIKPIGSHLSSTDATNEYFQMAQQPSNNTPSHDTADQPASVTLKKSGSSGSELRKLNFAEKRHSQSFRSNLSSSNQTSARSKDEISTLDGDEKEPTQLVSEFAKQTRVDEKFDQKLQQQRIKVAMRRNVLKRNLSEDLVWAAEVQANPNSDLYRFLGQDIDQYCGQKPQNLEVKSQASSLERNSFDDLDDEIGPSLRESLTDRSHHREQNEGSKAMTKTSSAHISKRKNKGKRQSSKTSLHSSGAMGNMQGLSGGSKDLNPLLNSSRGKRSSVIQDLQQTFSAKQKKTLSNQGSCSSLSSLIKTKAKPEDKEEFSDLKGGQPAGTLNSAQLEQLGPVVKMTINGFPFTTQSNAPFIQQPTSPSNMAVTSTQHNSTFCLPDSVSDADVLSQSASLFSTPSATGGHSFQMNSLIMSQRPVVSKNSLSSVHHHSLSSSLSKSANMYLFPIREQKIILMYKERETEFHFAQAKITLKLEEVNMAAAEGQQQLALVPGGTQAPQGSAALSTPTQSQSKKGVGLGDSVEGIGASASSPATPQKNGSHSKSHSQIEETKRTPTKHSKNPNLHTPGTPPSGKKDRNSTQKAAAMAGDTEAVEADDGLDEGKSSTDDSVSDRMVNLIVQKLLIDQMQHIRIDDSQNSILFDKQQDSQAVLKYLEVNELKFKYCRLCEVAIYSQYSISSDTEDESKQAIQDHFASKAHVRKRESYSIKEGEDLAYSLLVFSSQPGEIELELRKENEKALKRKVKRLKQSMQTLAVSHENASTYPGKELKSSNKNRLQIRCIELQKSVFPDIKFDTVEAILNDVLKVLEQRGAGDLHLMRKLKFVPTMVDMICKRISTCPRSKLGSLAKVINLVIKILTKYCSLRENRNYMIQTNRLMPLIDLLSWCLNRQTELFFGIEFMPGLFAVITSHLKHRVPFECQLLKEHMVDLLISSSIPAKLKNKLAIVKSIQSNEDEGSLGQVPFFLLKSVAFLEALTAMISIDARTRPVYEKSFKIGEHVFFVLQSTELLGITQMITTLLLTCNETFKVSAPSSASEMVLPQTILSLTIFSIKVLNNVMRMDVGIVQHLMQGLNEQLYHLLSFILSYTETNIDQSDDVKELLHETLIFIGYLCLLNEANQRTLHRGENSILQKLCNLPFTYFMDKRLKEILFPTLVTVSYLNERSVAIMDQEMNMTEFLVKYIEANIQEELPKIMEQEQEYFSDHTKSMSSFGRTRSPSQHSTGSNSNQSVQMDFVSGSNPYLPLVMRFPKNLWKDAAQYFKSKAD